MGEHVCVCVFTIPQLSLGADHVQCLGNPVLNYSFIDLLLTCGISGPTNGVDARARRALVSGRP